MHLISSVFRLSLSLSIILNACKMRFNYKSSEDLNVTILICYGLVISCTSCPGPHCIHYTSVGLFPAWSCRIWMLTFPITTQCYLFFYYFLSLPFKGVGLSGFVQIQSPIVFSWLILFCCCHKCKIFFLSKVTVYLTYYI